MSADARPEASSRGVSIGYWIATALFAAMMAFSAFGYLTQPMFAEAFRHLGFPSYFRIELAVAKLVGAVALLAPVPARMKEWAYAGFGITLVSAVVAHAVVDGPPKAAPPVVMLAVLAISYTLWIRRSRTTSSRATALATAPTREAVTV